MSTAFGGAQCAAQSVGTFNTMVNTLLQALLAAQCAISPPELWPQDYADQALKYGLDTYDFVVVGAGSAGSVIASRLSENPNWKVLVLEAGGDLLQESEVPALLMAFEHTNATWNYLTEYSEKACLGWANSRCYWPRGKMIGGSGGANVMVYVHGNRRDYDDWSQAGNIDWGWDDVLPYFERSIRPVGNKTHPQGYVILSSYSVYSENAKEMLLQGGAELGIPSVSEFNEGNDIGYSSILGTLKDGRRMSTGKVYLAKVSHRPNLHVIKNANVTKLNFDKSGKNVRSVSFILQGQYEMEVKIAKELVLSAGAIGSPTLLMLSGVGPAQHLNKLEIPVVHDLPVGNNLQDHVQATMFFELNENSARPMDTLDSLDNTYNYLIHKTGPLSTIEMPMIAGFINTLKDIPYPDIEFHPFYFRRGDFQGLDIFLYGLRATEDLKSQLYKLIADADLLCVFCVLLNPKSVGNIRLRSSNYSEPPIITHNYLNAPEDEATLLRAIRFQEQLLNTTAYKSMNASLFLPTITECDVYEHQSDEYWRCYLKYCVGT